MSDVSMNAEENPGFNRRVKELTNDPVVEHNLLVANGMDNYRRRLLQIPPEKYEEQSMSPAHIQNYVNQLYELKLDELNEWLLQAKANHDQFKQMLIQHRMYQIMEVDQIRGYPVEPDPKLRRSERVKRQLKTLD